VSALFSRVDAVYAAARWGWFVATFLLLGAASYAPFLFRARTALHRTDPDVARELARRAAVIGLVASLTLLGLALLRLYLQALTLVDPGEPVTGEFLRAVLSSSWGKGWLRQVTMVVLATLAFAAALSGAGARLGWLVASAASGGLGVTAGMTGHANTARAGMGGLLLDAAHVWTGGLWLGGLAVMLIAGLGACHRAKREERSSLIRALVADFSRRALLFGPLTIALGIWLAARYLGWRWPFHLAESTYGWVLGGKLAALAGVAALGGYNWRITRSRLARDRGEARLRRFGALELFFGSVLLAITAILVALPLPEARM
jgi:putative copper export protein